MGVPSEGAAHVFVPHLGDGELSLRPEDAHHVGRVLRLRAGERLTASDGQGSWCWCVWNGSAATADGPVVVELRPEPAVAVAFAPVKGDRPEWAVQKLTELGVDRIVGLVADRSVVRWDDDRAAKQQARWEAVAREAAMQSRRAWLPSVVSQAPYASAVGWPGACVADRGGDAAALDHPTVLIGPEGGWSERERALAADSGLPRIGLSDAVLRTETAAVAAAVALTTLRLRHGGQVGQTAH